ncbi:hypothetical protein PEPS_46500 (plasmid) [Persicobacter psychrovividus]|uniref:Uncharacterized protein n=2 Tax=Persicobacter psychrovividus TaxID=387638 RepID=A0ABN6LGU3_9BACT|nr:hypothetical protein PEPS_46500 [Persicobacter psychrovividus]
MVSCASLHDSPLEDATIIEESEENPISNLRATGDLNSRWDWTTSEPVVMYRMANNHPTKVVHENGGVKLPFWNISELANTQDMYPKDGWKLVFKNFGDEHNSPIGDLPSFALYNEYTGVFRIMTYIPHDLKGTYSSIASSLNVRQGDASQLLSFYSSPTELVGQTKGADFITEDDAWQDRWIHSDFILWGYDELLKSKNIIFDYKIEGVTENTGTGSGKISLEQILPKRSISQGRKSTIGTLKDFADTGLSFYKTGQGVQGFINDLTSKDSRKTNNKRVSQGATALTIASAAVGVVQKFIETISHKGGDNIIAPIKFKGVTTTNYSFKSYATLYSLPIALNTNSNHPSAIKPVQEIKWGIFKMNSFPKVEHIITEYTPMHNFMNTYQVETAEVLASELDITLRPDLRYKNRLECAVIEGRKSPISESLKRYSGSHFSSYTSYTDPQKNPHGVLMNVEEISILLNINAPNSTKGSFTLIDSYKAVGHTTTKRIPFVDQLEGGSYGGIGIGSHGGVE